LKAAKPVAKPAKVEKAVKVEKVAKPGKPAKAPQVPIAAVPVQKAVVVKSRSSVVDFPAPPAPIKPPFVPPKPTPNPAGSPVPAGSNGTHTPAFVQKQRQRLLDLRDDLVDAVSGMARDTIRNAPEGSEASGSGQHQGDAGSDAYDRDFALSVLAKEQDALYEIEQALRRIQSGSYGICEMSSRKIPQARLEAIPFARLTVECQGQWEKEYGNRRFRPSDEVGFSGGKYAEDEDSETVSLDEDED
jgi:RNA polymerase-binding transcription factor DksA